MIRLAAQENFDSTIIAGVRRRRPDLDLVRVQDVGLRGLAEGPVDDVTGDSVPGGTRAW